MRLLLTAKGMPLRISTAREIERIVLGVISASVVICALFYKPIKDSLAGTWISPFFSFGSFLVLYRLLLFVYDKVLWDIVHRKHSLNGYWGVYVRNDDSSRTLYGAFRILQDAYGAEIKDGKTHLLNDRAPCDANEFEYWQSQASGFDGRHLLVDFIARRVHPDPAAGTKVFDSYHGVMLLISEEEATKPKKFRGSFLNLPPAREDKGSVTVWRVSRWSLFWRHWKSWRVTKVSHAVELAYEECLARKYFEQT